MHVCDKSLILSQLCVIDELSTRRGVGNLNYQEGHLALSAIKSQAFTWRQGSLYCLFKGIKETQCCGDFCNCLSLHEFCTCYWTTIKVKYHIGNEMSRDEHLHHCAPICDDLGCKCGRFTQAQFSGRFSANTTVNSMPRRQN